MQGHWENYKITIMNNEYENLELFNNHTGNRFSMQVGSHLVFIDYKLVNDRISLLHTETPIDMRGKGAATAILEKTLAYIEQFDYKLIPVCHFVTAYLKTHPTWKRLLDESVKNV